MKPIKSKRAFSGSQPVDQNLNHSNDLRALIPYTLRMIALMHKTHECLIEERRIK